MKFKPRWLIAVLVLVCLGLAIPNQASAGLRDKFSRWEDSLGPFSRFSDPLSPLKRLTELNGKLKTQDSAFSKFANLGDKFLPDLNPSFNQLADLSAMSATFKPSFERMTSLKNLDTGLNPSFAKLASIEAKFSGGLNSSFESLATLKGMEGSLNPSFVNLASIAVDLNSSSLNPSFEKIADINISFDLSPAFSQLVSIDPRLNPDLNTKFLALAGQKELSMNLVQVKPHAFYAKAKNLNTIGLAQKPIFFAPVDVPLNLLELSIDSKSLTGVSSVEIAELIARDAQIIQPNGGLIPVPVQNPAAASVNVSLISLLAAEAK
ncbi:MAG: hypothetical protein KJ977_02595 [Candidatus Omnitrophica bacterium]|nr:hypothetical protein [Candidatus Omnitrophota bacterium]MBU2265906.1 hypothetical protein [Candidatus Omnitrophota bacterium]MBU2473531.1 hypothetical protein [Candidatus Omnitrophota bacterium]